MFVMSHVCNVQIVQPINFPHLPICCTHIIYIPNYYLTYFQTLHLYA
jgi:hypothetical protein